MFSQVVGTALRLTERHADRWLRVTRLARRAGLRLRAHRRPAAARRGRRAPAARLRRGIEPTMPPPGRRSASSPASTACAPGRVAAEAADACPTRTGRRPRRPDDVGFAFPDEIWARVVYGSLLAHHRRRLSDERLIEALVPLYFGRVASLVLETRAARRRGGRGRRGAPGARLRGAQARVRGRLAGRGRTGVNRTPDEAGA